MVEVDNGFPRARWNDHVQQKASLRPKKGAPRAMPSAAMDAPSPPRWLRWASATLRAWSMFWGTFAAAVKLANYAVLSGVVAIEAPSERGGS
ncbi:MAG: hypothetical protein AAF628_15930 [Planctomycetota bacterium]